MKIILLILMNLNLSWFSRWKEKIEKFYDKYTEQFKYIKDFFLYVFIYGIIFNYAIHVSLGFPFKYYTFPGWGFFFYLIKEEIPQIVKKCRSRR